jgi:GH24 family phage-related lysozyme (muramidase)
MPKKKIIRQPSKETLDLLLKHEVGGGKDYYEKYLSGFTWPGASSGPTIAIGIDCAYYTETELRDIFNFLSENEINLICGSIGKTGLAGKEYTLILKKQNIKVSWDQALEIFNNITWYKFSKLAESTFPGLDRLCDNAYGAIVSLVFNRGSSLIGHKRIEMRTIRDLIPQKKYKEIANQIRKMKRLWVGKNLNGLLDRRDDEAKLIETCV